MEQMDCVVIGAGVVGLAIARELAARGRETLVLEAADAIGTATSSRNSEVIHAGLYYPRGSLKATSRARARPAVRILRDPSRAAPARGKLLVATSAAQVKQLRAIAARATENGVLDLMPLTRAEAQTLGRARMRRGAVLALHRHRRQPPADARAARRRGARRRRVRAEIPGRIDRRAARRPLRRAHGRRRADRDRGRLRDQQPRRPALARRTRGLDPRWVPPLYLARGNYFSLSGAHRFPT